MFDGDIPILYVESPFSLNRSPKSSILLFLSRPLLLTRWAPLLLWPGTLAADAVARDAMARKAVARDAVYVLVSVLVFVAVATAAVGPRGQRHGVTAKWEDQREILQENRGYLQIWNFRSRFCLQTILRL